MLLEVRFCALMRSQLRVYCGCFVSSWNQTGVVDENDTRFFVTVLPVPLNHERRVTTV